MNDSLKVCWISAKFVSCLLSEVQVVCYSSVCQDLQERLERDQEFLSKTFTVDEMWIYGYTTDAMILALFKQNCIVLLLRFM